MKYDYIAETDRKGTYIFEGEKKANRTFSINRCICTVQPQETAEKTKELADFIIKKLEA